MNSRAAYEQYRKIVTDEGDNAFLSPPKFIVAYVKSRRNWLKSKAQEPESEYIRRLLGELRRTQTFTSEAIKNGIALTAFTEKPAFIRGVTCDFGAPGNLTLRERPCKPLTDDNYGVALDDPTRRPTDFYPAYIEENNRLVIKSGTLPASVTVRYLWEPGVPELTQSTQSVLIETDAAIDEILERIASRQDLTEGNDTRYNLTARQEIPVREQNQ